MKQLTIAVLALLSISLFTACDDDTDLQPTSSEFNLNIEKLENLGADFAYEGWIIVDGAPVSTGVFDVDDQGNLSTTTFSVNSDDLNNATAFVLTIEPRPDNDPAPSDVHILAGDISNSTANLSISHSAAIGTGFTSTTGKYILATPTNGENNDENSGVWFLDPSSGSPMAGLDLPTLPAAWEYEGWAVINGQPVTTGKFTSVDGSDDLDSFSGSMSGPPFPGEDFLENAPAGLSFPVDLSGAKIVISIEPVPDNSEAPFLLKPLAADVPQNAQDHTVYDLDNIAASTYPSGTFSFNR